MSIAIMSKLFVSGPSKGNKRLVMLALADFANDEGVCWPSLSAIAEKSCYESERGVQIVIRQLEAEGWLKISTGGGRRGCNEYQITFPNEGKETLDATETPNASSPRRDDVKTPKSSSPRTALHPEEPMLKPRRARSKTPKSSSPEPLEPLEPSYMVGAKAEELNLSVSEVEAKTDFDEFWDAYPKKVGKPKAKLAFSKAVKTTSPKIIIAGAKRYAASISAKGDDPRGTYTKHPQGWLTDERWNDAMAPATPEAETYAQRIIRQYGGGA